MATTKPGTVVETGASAGALLVGMEPMNRGLLIRVHRAQEPGDGARIVGSFEVVEAGFGWYAAHFRPFVGQSFSGAAEFVTSVAAAPGARKCTHVLNRNSLKISA